MSLEQIIPYIAIISFGLVISGLIYGYGKSRQKAEEHQKEINRKLDDICKRVDNVPDKFLPLFIDLYKMYDKMKDNPEPSRRRKSGE